MSAMDEDTKDEGTVLEELSSVLTALQSNPYDLAKHYEHIRLASSLSGMEEQAVTAREMMVETWAASEDSAATSDEELQSFLTRDTVRELLRGLVAKGSGHITKGHVLWEQWLSWEMEYLASSQPTDEDLQRVQTILLSRLHSPHSELDTALQEYSTFISTYLPDANYEEILVAANKAKGEPQKRYGWRERWEMTLRQAQDSPAVYSQYIDYEWRRPDPQFLVPLYERAIAETARRRLEPGGEETLQTFWSGLHKAVKKGAEMWSNAKNKKRSKKSRGQDEDMDDTEIEEELTNLQTTEALVLERAARSTPFSVAIWVARILSAGKTAEGDIAEMVASVDGLTDRAVALLKLKPADSDTFVQIGLASADAFRLHPQTEDGIGRPSSQLPQLNPVDLRTDETAFGALVTTLPKCIEAVRQATAEGDPRLRLEQYLATAYTKLIRGADFGELVTDLWKTTEEHYKQSYLACTLRASDLAQRDDIVQARDVYKRGASRPLDWPEQVWDSWILFEHIYGDESTLEAAQELIDKHQVLVMKKRQKARSTLLRSNCIFTHVFEQEAIKAAEAYAAADATDNAPAPIEATVDESLAQVIDDAAMDVDGGPNDKRKRKAEGPIARRVDPEPTKKKAKPVGSGETEIRQLFRDCGEIREVKFIQVDDQSVVTVEFMDRESIPAALTKDKKRIDEAEINVHLAWKSTLYITNFLEKTDDTEIRRMFSPFGKILDVRWPSKKFKATRRFCYLQFTSPASAQAALSLHGTELEPGQPMSVYISNPERKKERTDAGADQREVYIAGLSKFSTRADLEQLFGQFGAIKEIRLATDNEGNAKGYAFVEFEQESSASQALSMNNHELKKRRIAVTLADSRVHARHKIDESAGLTRKAEIRSRSLRVRKLPPGTTDGLLQQTFEKLAPVVGVQVTEEKGEAIVELKNAADVGRLLLLTGPITFNGAELEIEEEGTTGPAKPSGPFVPRAAGSRPRAGLGSKKARQGAAKLQTAQFVQSGGEAAPTPVAKNQDDFRNMLLSGKK
ncbi:Splicing factor [Ceratobasidium sp. 414]|nr:Splicing factor [Ceratobasidium sp. 414]